MNPFAGLDPQLAVAVGGGLVCVVALVMGARALFGGRRDEVIDRLERATSSGMEQAIDARETESDRSVARIAQILRPFARFVKPSGGEDESRLNQSLTHAGYRSSNAVEIFLGVKLLLPVVAIIGIWQVDSHLESPMEFPLNVAIVVIGCAVSFFLPNIWLSGRITSRKQRIESALPDSMDLLVTCVEAGLALDAAMARVAQEMDMVEPILAQELKHTMLEIQAGIRRAEAFRRLASRTGVEDLRTLSAMIIQTEMFGTSVSRALRVHSEAMRTRRMQRAEEKAAMVSVKMTVPLILFILPSLLAVVLGPAAAMIAKMGN